MLSLSVRCPYTTKISTITYSQFNVWSTITVFINLKARASLYSLKSTWYDLFNGSVLSLLSMSLSIEMSKYFVPNVRSGSDGHSSFHFPVNFYNNSDSLVCIRTSHHIHSRIPVEFPYIISICDLLCHIICFQDWITNLSQATTIWPPNEEVHDEPRSSNSA